jgi:hypothetical protein
MARARNKQQRRDAASPPHEWPRRSLAVGGTIVAVGAAAYAHLQLRVDDGWLVEADEWRSKLGWPQGYSAGLDHLTKSPFGRDRCDFERVPHCDATKFLRPGIHRAHPIMFTGCTEALGLVPDDLTKAAILSAVGSTTSIKKVPNSNTFGTLGTDTWDGHVGAPVETMDFADAVGENASFYFEAGQGKLHAALVRRQRQKRPPPLQRLFDMRWNFSDSVDSVQRDESVVAHEHLATWLYLALGVKLWFVSPFEATPPAEVQWGVPHTSWLLQEKLQEQRRSRSSSAIVGEWAPLVCTQRAGDVILLPSFWWHATVSIGSTVAFGQQGPEPSRLQPADLPPAVMQINSASSNEEMRAAIERMRALNPASIKLLLMVLNAGWMPKEWVKSQLQATLESAEALRAEGSLSHEDAGAVQSLLRNVLERAETMRA